MATIREWLDEAGFDWDNGIIIYHPTSRYLGDEPEAEDDFYFSPNHGWNDRNGKPVFMRSSGLAGGKEAREWRVVNYEFGDGYGGPGCPRFIAYDSDATYFPAQYDGSTWLEKVYLNPGRYMGDNAIETPYPGG